METCARGARLSISCQKTAGWGRVGNNSYSTQTPGIKPAVLCRQRYQAAWSTARVVRLNNNDDDDGAWYSRIDNDDDWCWYSSIVGDDACTSSADGNSDVDTTQDDDSGVRATAVFLTMITAKDLKVA